MFIWYLVEDAKRPSGDRGCAEDMKGAANAARQIGTTRGHDVPAGMMGKLPLESESSRSVSIADSIRLLWTPKVSACPNTHSASFPRSFGNASRATRVTRSKKRQPNRCLGLWKTATQRPPHCLAIQDPAHTRQLAS